tara:strand:+ start:185 stop:451 length:267 start_codon:yes stop_codon:yes gene_type:complete
LINSVSKLKKNTAELTEAKYFKEKMSELFDPVAIERWLERDTMRKLDLIEHRRFMRELDKVGQVLDAVEVQAWETKVSKRIRIDKFWV